MSGDKEHRAGVSVQLGTSYMKAIPMNENVKIVSKVLRTGKQLATAEVRFYDKVCVISTYVTIFILSLNLLNGTVLRSIFNALLGQRALRC
jgi:acyl-coenzyme A thioesterase PaaI-like protein